MRVRLGQTGSITAADCQLWQAERTTRRHSRDDPREDVAVRDRVRVGPVEFQLYELSAQGLRKGDEHPTNTPHGV